MLQPKSLIHLIEVMDSMGIDYMVTGSVVSSLQGEPRSTHDIDIVINIKASSIPALEQAFPAPKYYLDSESIKAAIADRTMFNLLNTEEGDKIDFWMLTEDPFDHSRFFRKYSENLFGKAIKISSPEDTILAKLRWAKLSGGSEKQFLDALRVYEVQFEKLDKLYIEKWVEALGVEELWKELLIKANPIT